MPDHDRGPRDVEVEIWVDEFAWGRRFDPLLRTSLLVSARGVAVEDVVSADNEQRAAVAPGEYEATVYGRPAPLPQQIRVLLTTQD